MNADTAELFVGPQMHAGGLRPPADLSLGTPEILSRSPGEDLWCFTERICVARQGAVSICGPFAIAVAVSAFICAG
jgi:hypothetical protein